MELVLFHAHENRYALPAERVGKVIELLPVTPLPYAPSTAEGLVNVSGSVLLKVSLPELLGVPPERRRSEGVLLVVSTSREMVVIQVDSVSSKVTLDESDLTRYGSEGAPGLVAGEFTLDGQMVLLLSPDALALDDMQAVGVPEGGGGLVGRVEDTRDRAELQQVSDLELVTVQDGGEAYAFAMQDVVEIIEVSAFTRLPNVSAEVEGLMLMRGKALLVLSLARLLNRPQEEPARFILVLSAGDASLGISVSQVIGIERYLRDEIQAADASEAQLDGYLPGAGLRAGKMTGLVSVRSLLPAERMEVYRRYLHQHGKDSAIMAEIQAQSVRRLLAFKLGNERCALALGSVDRVEEYVNPVDLPEGDDMFSGVVQIKGEVAPVLDLRRALGYPQSDTAAYVVVRVDGSAWALVVDKVDRVIEIQERDITPVRNNETDFVNEIGRLNGELVSLLSLDPLARAA
jgi:purine-binding chemotaxis protein CheW